MALNYAIMTEYQVVPEDFVYDTKNHSYILFGNKDDKEFRVESLLEIMNNPTFEEYKILHEKITKRNQEFAEKGYSKMILVDAGSFTEGEFYNNI